MKLDKEKLFDKYGERHEEFPMGKMILDKLKLPKKKKKKNNKDKKTED
jgi:hypothetical protein